MSNSELDRKRTTTKIVVFLVLTFLISAVWWFLAIRDGDLGDVQAIALMWSPGVAALITKLAFDRSLRGMGWAPGKFKYILLASVIPLVYCLAIYVPVWLLGIGGFSGAGPFFSTLGLALITLPLGLFQALGEELGWRGLLVPGLYKLTTFTRTALLSGVIWAVWHLPLVVTGIYAAGTQTWYEVLMFSIAAIGISVMLAWLRLRSGSLWPSVFYHAIHNALIQSVFDGSTSPKDYTLYLTTEFGLGLALAAVVLGYLFWRRRGDLPESGEMAAA